MRRVVFVSLAVAWACAAVAPAWAQWEQELSIQIEEDLGCKVAFLSQVVDRVVDGRHIVMAKVHCEDERTYDAYRDDDLMLFDFKECEPPDAQAC